MNFNIITLGCKVNQYGSQAMSEMLINNGFKKATDPYKADITIINTCTVTAVTDAKNRKVIHKTRRNNPDGVIVLTGCMPQAFPDRLSDFEDCDIVIGNKQRGLLIPTLNEFFATHKQIVRITPHENKGGEFEKMSVDDFSGHTRAFIKIEDGCDMFCTYCIIPYSRGRVRSKSLEDIITEIETIAKNGYKEVVLVGINLSAYGKGTEYNLADAVDVVCSVGGIERVRLGSFEPEMMTDELIKRFSAQEKFCPQFHLSLQSGCDGTLKRMHRHYNSIEYMELVKSLRKNFDNASITTDVMVGFPGETEQEFKESLNFVKSVKFSKVHVFPYSRRKGSVADKMDNQIDSKTKDERSKIMIQETEKNRVEFMDSQVGLIESVLVERKREGGYYEGYTKNYTPVHIFTNENIAGEIVNVKISSVENDYCIGELN